MQPKQTRLATHYYIASHCNTCHECPSTHVTPQVAAECAPKVLGCDFIKYGPHRLCRGIPNDFGHLVTSVVLQQEQNFGVGHTLITLLGSCGMKEDAGVAAVLVLVGPAKKLSTTWQRLKSNKSHLYWLTGRKQVT